MHENEKYLDLNHSYFILVPKTEYNLNDLYDARFYDEDKDRVKDGYHYMMFNEATFLLMEEYLFNFIDAETGLIITMYEEEWAEVDMLPMLFEITERMINNSDNDEFIKLADEFLELVKKAIDIQMPVVFYF